MNKLFAPFLPPWAETGLQPAFYDLESGTVLQQTARMYDKVNQLIRLFNQLSEETKATVEEYIAKFIELKDFVDDYFDNLDVQEEINNKLDQMAEDGTLQEIIGDYLNATAVWGFDTVAEMKASSNLINGSFARTLGYHAKNDGGGGLYKIRTVTNQDVEDDGSIIALNDHSLVAELVVEEEVSVKQFGAKGNGVTDDTESIQKCIDFANVAKKPVYIPSGNYLVSTLEVNYQGANIFGDGRNTVIRSINNNNENVILQFSELGAMAFIARNFYIHGNKENNANEIVGIKVTTNTERGDCNSLLENVTVTSCTGHGIFINSSRIRELRVSNCITQYNKRKGFCVFDSTDNYFYNITAGSNKEEGFYIIGGANKVMNCKAHHNGYGDFATLDPSRAPESAFTETSDATPVAGKSYYIRSGEGTSESPYEFTLFEGSTFAPDVTYYEMTTLYYKRYSGFFYQGKNSIFSNCEAQDNFGDGFYVYGGNNSFSSVNCDNNGYLAVSEDTISTPVSYASQGLEQIYDGFHISPWANEVITGIADNFRNNSIGKSQRSALCIEAGDGFCTAMLSCQNQVTNVISQKQLTANHNKIVVNGADWYDEYDVSRLEVNAGYEIVSLDSTNYSYLRKCGDRKEMKLIVKKTEGNIETTTDTWVAKLPNRFKPKCTVTTFGAMSSWYGNNINGTANIVMGSGGNVEVRKTSAANPYVVITATFI